MKNFTLFLIIIFAFTETNAQVLSQNANWPNGDWTLSGTFTSSGLLSDPTTTGSTFTFDDDEAGSSSDDTIQAASPEIDLTSASNAGETWITITGSYVYRPLGNDILTIETYNADTATWSVLETFVGNAANNSYQTCSGTDAYVSTVLDISGFTPTQLSGFRYRFSYDDLDGWQWGWCLTSPTIVSQEPPACPNPINLAAINVTETTADLQWTEAGSSGSWNVQWGPAGFPLG